MKATFYSPCNWLIQAWLAAVLLLFSIPVAVATAEDSTDARFAENARTRYVEAVNRFRADGDNPTNAAQLACSCYDAADFATNDSERAVLAREGISACRGSIVQHPDYAPTHYYLAMNLGQLAKTEILSALSLLPVMEQEFKVAAALDPLYDYAGPERNLGLLYLQAPRIASIGSHRKAREFLESAANVAPDYPENQLNLAEAYLKWNEPENAGAALQLLDDGWVKAQVEFSGDAWAQSWEDWTTRREDAEKKLDKIHQKKPVK